MPSGFTHDIVTIATAPALGVALHQFGGEPAEVAVITGAYFFAGMMFSGDLDIESKQFYRWRILRFIWIPYQRMFHHRSEFTHGALLGTIVRLLYFAVVVSLAWPVAHYALRREFLSPIDVALQIGGFINQNRQLSFLIFGGLFLGAASHSIADKFVSFAKRKLRGK